MRIVKLILLFLIAICLIVVGFANRQPVELTIFAQELVPFTQFNAGVTLPLYAVVFGGVGLGILLGFLIEWLREHRHRKQASQERRARQSLEREVAKLKRERGDDQDDVRTLLEKPKRPAA